MGKHFNADESFGRHSTKTLRIEDAGGGDEPDGNGWRVMMGGMLSNGKLKQAQSIAYCETRVEAETLMKKLCDL